jgi:CubicO group peptidase (beta-lactamase class C family)
MKTRLPLLILLLAALTACKLLTPALPATDTQVVPTHVMVVSPTTIPTAVPTTPIPAPSPTVLPDWEWPRSTPEEQGLSSAKLAAMLELLRRENRPVHSVLVVRHGVLVLEAYAHPFNAQTRHGIYSVTKSVTSALAGIANGEGLLGGVETPVISYFPTVTIDDPRKETIRIENLLAMNSGVEWMEPLYSGLNDLWGIHEADDPAQYFFNPALIEEPGAVFNYNSGGSHLLSMLVQATSGQPAADFAAAHLFAPLSIRNFHWENDFTGHTKGGTGLELLPVDMAKIGLLYLNRGQWQGRRIVPADWVSASTVIRSIPYEGMGYGYQWWIRPQGDYYALGWGGQQIRVFPEQDMVVIFTAGMSGEGMYHNDLVDDYLLPAVQSVEPLPADPLAQKRLEAAIIAWASPQMGISKSLSRLAAEVDGKGWLMTGRGNWSMFTLHFPGGDEAQIDLTLDGDPLPLKVGMDGVYRVTDTKDYGPIALYGYWESSHTFTLVQQNLREADRRVTRVQFNGEAVKLYSQWFVEPYEEESEGELFGN